MHDLADRHQFESAYRRLAPLVRRVAQGVLRDSVTADDVVQDVFLQLWRNPGGYDPARGTLKTYVALLAHSRSIDRTRSRAAEDSAFRRLAAEARTEARPPVDDMAEAVLRRERSGRLLAAVGDLPADQREAVLLAFGGGLSAREIASSRDLPLGTAKSRIRLGLAKARAQLGEAA